MYDEFGNFISDYNTGLAPVDPEEERRRREEELRKQQEAAAGAVAQEEKVTTYADGTRTITTKKEVPAQPVAPQAVDQSVYTAQMESGGKPDIGYHFPQDASGRRASTAFGAYGLTAPAYADIQQANPQFAGRDITTLNPEEQKAAYDTYTGLNAQRLQKLGIQPTPEAQRLAHLLGAGGAARFLTTGEISPQAAAANGGIENLKRIAQARLQGQPAPASGAAQTPVAPVSPTSAQPLAPVNPAQAAAFQEANAGIQGQPSPYSLAAEKPVMAPAEKAINDYQATQNDPMALMKLSQDENAPEFIKERARNRAADLLTQQKEIKAAQEKVQGADETQLAKWLKERTTGGSWVKAILFAAMGAKQLAQEEGAKLGIGTESVVMGPDGKPAIIKMSANGTPLEGFDGTTGQKLTAEQLVSVAAGATSLKDAKSFMMPQTSGSPVTKTIDGKIVNGIQIYDPVSKSFYVQYGNKRDTSPEGWTSAAQNLEQQSASQIQKQNIDLQGDWAKLQMKVQGAAPEAANKYLGEFNAKHGTQFGLQSITGSAPQIDPQTRKFVQAYEGAPAAGATTATTVAAPVIPGSAPLPTNTTTSISGTGAKLTPVAPNASPADIESARERQKKEEESKLKMGEKQTEGVIKHVNETLVPQSLGGQQGSDAVKKQFAIMNDPAQSDVLFGLYNKAQTNSASDKNWAIVRDVLGGKLDTKDTEVSKAIAQVKLNATEKSALDAYAVNNGVLTTAAIKTGGFGSQISDRDRISAEKLQINIAETPALGVYNIKGQQLFGFDLARYKSDWSADKNYGTVAQLERAWAKEQAALTEKYGKVADERNAFIKANSDGKSATIGLVRDAYRRYPVPQYDPNLNSGAGGWRNMRDRELNEILKGNR